MILSKSRILAEIKRGCIAITPFDASAVGACSVDLSLSPNFRVFSRNHAATPLSDKLDYLRRTKPFTASAAKPLVLKPKELVLGATAERITLSSKHCGWLEGRSRMARLGLAVHVSSGLVQPGVDNVQVLEIVNNSPSPIALVPGVRVCQIVFEELAGRAAYTGVFLRQSKP